MDLVKKNLVSVICGVVALIAVVVSFYPIGGMYTGLQAKVHNRAGQYDALDKVIRTNRTIPTLSGRPEDVTPLPYFPTVQLINYGKTITAGWTTESENFFNQANKLNELTPLVPETLPGTNANALSFVPQFRKMYRLKFGRDTKPDAKRATNPELAVAVLDGGLPPTAAEIARTQDNERRKITARMTIYDDKNKPVNGPAVEKEVNDKLAAIPESMREQAAQNYRIYVGRDAFLPSDAIGVEGSPSFAAIFDAQVGLWVQEEFAKAIAATNNANTPAVTPDKPSAKSVVNAPIKRLVKIGSIRHPFGASAASGGGRGGGGGGMTGGGGVIGGMAPGAMGGLPTGGPNPMMPAGTAAPTAPPLSNDEASSLPSAYSKTPTGHTSNALYDVVNFEVELIVDVAKLPTVLNGLSAGRYLTITNVDVTAVNSEVERAAGFIYGPAPVARLRLTCEYLLMRKWLTPLMPEEVLQRLGATPTP